MKIKSRSLSLALCLTAATIVIVVTGCATGDRYTRSTGEYLDDNSLKGRVHSALTEDPVYKFGAVTVTAFKGTVQLGGFVFTGDQQKRAGEVAQHVYGVRDVVNNIIIRENDHEAWDDNRRNANNRTADNNAPKSSERRVDDNNRTTREYVDDKTLTARVKSALNHDETKLDEVNVTAYESKVLLSGFANTSEQKDRAGEIAKQVPGVKEVANKITVKDKL